jgi:Uma2 family endonuclease
VLPSTNPATLDDLRHTPDDGYSYELVEGVILRMPPPQDEHSNVQANIIHLLKNWAKVSEHGGRVRGELGLLLDVGDNQTTVLGPDVTYIAPDHYGERDQAYEHIAPDLVVEIVSPSQSRTAILKKVRFYLAAGVALVWVAWPGPEVLEVWQADATTQEHARTGDPLPSILFTPDATLSGFDVLPAFSCTVAELFKD